MSHITKDIILTTSSNSTITAYHPCNTAPLSSFSGSLTPRQGITFTKTRLIAATHISPDSPSSGYINLYNWWAPIPFHSIHVPEPVAPIVCTSDGSFIFSGGVTGRMYVFAFPSHLLHRTFQAHEGPVSCMTINDDGTLLISGSEDGSIAAFSILQTLDLYNVERDISPLYKISAHDSEVTCISSGASYMISSSVDGTCKAWNVVDGGWARNFQFACSVSCVAVDYLNSMAYSGGSDGCVYAMSIKRKSRRKEVVGITVWDREQCGAVVAVTMMNERRNLVSAWEEGTVKVWDVESGSIVSVLGKNKSGCSISGLFVGRVVDGGVMEDELGSNGYCERVMSGRGGRNVEEMKGWLDVVRNDRSRAMDMLEDAMETYERLLSLLLKEAEGGKDVDEETKHP